MFEVFILSPLYVPFQLWREVREPIRLIDVYILTVDYVSYIARQFLILPQLVLWGLAATWSIRDADTRNKNLDSIFVSCKIHI